jgi:aspartyl-tRNA(Asn)/glutamyl-tRNA(Gln) amidotransferase subunit B
LEVQRQQDILEQGGTIAQETRLYDAVKHETRSMRSKEEANDYRYFPDPDLLPVEITDALIAHIKQTLPELPEQKKRRFIKDLGLSEYDADILTAQKTQADYFEIMLENNTKNAKLCANWVMGELAAFLNKNQLEIENSPVSAKDLSQLVARIGDATISGKTAKDVFKAMWDGDGNADEIIESKGLKQITDTGAIEAIVDEIITNNAAQVAQFQSGNEKILGFFVGQAMKATGGKANPKLLNELLRKKLG